MSTKCKVKGLHVEPCEGLHDACEGDVPTGKARGVYRWAFTNLTTHKPSRTLFGVKTSGHPKGLIFNFCPWCGANFSKAQQ